MNIPCYKLKVRWSDLDANMHLANASYMNFTSYARVERFNSIGLGLEEVKKQKTNAVIFHERFSFYREIYAHQEVYVTADITGLSDSADLFEFTHNFYSMEGMHLCASKIFGTWIDYNSRKRAVLTNEWQKNLKDAASPNCRIITMEDIKALSPKSNNIDVQDLQIIE